MNLRDVTAAATERILDAAPDDGATVPARSWPSADHAWTVTDSGRDALRGPERAGTGAPGGLTPTDPRSPGSVDAGGAR